MKPLTIFDQAMVLALQFARRLGCCHAHGTRNSRRTESRSGLPSNATRRSGRGRANAPGQRSGRDGSDASIVMDMGGKVQAEPAEPQGKHILMLKGGLGAIRSQPFSVIGYGVCGVRRPAWDSE